MFDCSQDWWQDILWRGPSKILYPSVSNITFKNYPMLIGKSVFTIVYHSLPMQWYMHCYYYYSHCKNDHQCGYHYY